MTYREKLKNWYRQKRANGTVNLNFYEGSGSPLTEEVAKEAFEVLNGDREVINETNVSC